MKENKIYKWSLFYELLRCFVRFAHRLFYSSVVVTGKENIPKGVPVIFAPNHQNALMDPLAIVCTLRDQVVFLARADIFSNKISRFFLRFLKILPIFRIRDGKENLDNNQYIFDLAVDVLKHNNKICIMPEGTQNDKHQLRPLLKGIFRIAFKAFENNPSTVIVPVGIDYSDYSSYRAQLIVQYGKPIKISDYKDTYLSNPPKATNILRSHLTNEIKKLMINIESSEYYNIIDKSRETFRPLSSEKTLKTNKTALNRFYADKWFTEKCNEIITQEPFIDKLILVNERTTSQMKKHNLKEDALCNHSPNAIAIILKISFSLIYFPFFLLSLILNSPVFYIPYLINKKISDKQFHSSMKFSITFLAFPVYYILLFILINCFAQSLLISFGLCMIAFGCGIFSIYYLSIIKSLLINYHSIIYANRIKSILSDLHSFNFK